MDVASRADIYKDERDISLRSLRRGIRFMLPMMSIVGKLFRLELVMAVKLLKAVI